MQLLTIHTMVLFDAILFYSSSATTVARTINCLVTLSVIPLLNPGYSVKRFSMKLEKCIKLSLIKLFVVSRNSILDRTYHIPYKLFDETFLHIYQ